MSKRRTYPSGMIDHPAFIIPSKSNWPLKEHGGRMKYADEICGCEQRGIRHYPCPYHEGYKDGVIAAQAGHTLHIPPSVIEDAQATERTRIVTWLRGDCTDDSCLCAECWAARAIERGEHLPERAENAHTKPETAETSRTVRTEDK